MSPTRNFLKALLLKLVFFSDGFIFFYTIEISFSVQNTAPNPASMRLLEGLLLSVAESHKHPICNQILSHQFASSKPTKSSGAVLQFPLKAVPK